VGPCRMGYRKVEARRRLRDRGVERLVGVVVCEGRLLGGREAAMSCILGAVESPETRFGQARGIMHLTNGISVSSTKGGRRQLGGCREAEGVRAMRGMGILLMGS
jgi:hypothetical protein